MELPHIGNNCHLPACNRLDFLPVKCDACSQVFCVEHYRYDTHNCEKGQSKNVQVPVCPLCSEPVSCRRDQVPDIAVSQHIDNHCRRNTLNKTTKPKTNLQACTFKSCRQKDIINLQCSECKSRFCIKHRHPKDHQCPGSSRMQELANNWQTFKGSCTSKASSRVEAIKSRAHQISQSGQAALNRLTTRQQTSGDPQPSSFSVSNVQGNLSEQEALAIALQESSSSTFAPQPAQQNSTMAESEDEILARVIRESEMEALRQQSHQGNRKDPCVVS